VFHTEQMGSCIICGASVDGRICDSHEEDVVFDFRGDSPSGLESGRFYRGTVDGYADFGVFVDLAPGVTGLLHRSELDRRLESLDWAAGNAVFVQVKNVRDNGNVDLAWSIRQAEREFRGTLVQENGTEHEPPERAGESGEASPDDGRQPSTEDADAEEGTDGESEPAAGTDDSAADAGGGAAEDEASGERADATGEDTGTTARSTDPGAEAEPVDGADDADDPAPSGDRERVAVESLGDRVDDTVRLDGEIVSVRQTGGPTVFELRDETGVVDVAAFVEPGVRAYPEVEVGDTVRIDGEVEVRRNEIQVETEGLAVLDGEAAESVRRRLADALTEKARPDGLEPLTDDGTVADLSEGLLDAAEAIRRAVLESRPIVVRHPATADGYVAGAAVERAAMPLIREEHAESDAEYHYFDRRPLETAVYDMDAATNDATRMLQDRDRHDEKLPLFLLVGTGSTVESADGLRLLDVYDAKRVVVDAAVADPEVKERVDALVSPELADTDGRLSTGALAATLAAAVNGDVRADLGHLPAVSYWEDVPEAYVDLAREAGYDAERVAELREAVALEAYYQAYEDKRELVADLLFDDGGELAGHVSEQFREKLDREAATAEANLDVETAGGVEFAVLDTDAFTHRFDFPPTGLLLDELHRRNREGDFATVGIGTDELHLRTTADLSVREVAAAAAEHAPEADVTAAGVRDGRIEFLSGEREAVETAVVEAVADRY